MKRAASIFIALLILLSSMSMLTVLAVNETETPLLEEPLDLSNERSSTAAITIDLAVYRNSDMTESASMLNAYITAVNSAFRNEFDVEFNQLRNVSTSSLNQRDGCTRSIQYGCYASCGTESDGSDCIDEHHRASSYYIDVAQHSLYHVLRFVEYGLCHYDSGGHGYVNGLQKGPDTIVSLYSDHIPRTITHELSHCIGSDDRVCTDGEACVMNNSTVLVWCTQCTEDIINYLEQNY